MVAGNCTRPGSLLFFVEGLDLQAALAAAVGCDDEVVFGVVEGVHDDVEGAAVCGEDAVFDAPLMWMREPTSRYATRFERADGSAFWQPMTAIIVSVAMASMSAKVVLDKNDRKASFSVAAKTGVFKGKMTVYQMPSQFTANFAGVILDELGGGCGYYSVKGKAAEGYPVKSSYPVEIGDEGEPVLE